MAHKCKDCGEPLAEICPSCLGRKGGEVMSAKKHAACVDNARAATAARWKGHKPATKRKRKPKPQEAST